MLKFFKAVILTEVIELIGLVLIYLAWRFYIKDRLPKVWRDNLIMMGVVK